MRKKYIFVTILTTAIIIIFGLLLNSKNIKPTFGEDPWRVGTVVRIDVSEPHQITIGSRDYLYTVQFDEGDVGQYYDEFAYVQRFRLGDKVALKLQTGGCYNSGVYKRAKLVEVIK